MNEQDISNAVKAVLEGMNANGSHHAQGHVCKCKKNKMTLDKANSLIDKVKAKAETMGLNVVIAVADAAGETGGSSEHGWCLYSKFRHCVEQIIYFGKLKNVYRKAG